MATLRQANKAREDHSNLLRDLGAHSIGVDRVEVKGKPTYAVVAFIKEAKEKVPAYLEIEWNEQIKKVPLVVKQADEFRPESL